MSKNWLTLWQQGTPAAAGTKAQLAAKQDDFARRVEQLRRSTGKIETRRMRFICACTSGRFFAEFERMNPKEQFRIARIAREENAAPEAAASGPAWPRAEKVYDHREFDFSFWHCPCCERGTDMFVYCHCGNNVCQGRTKRLPDGSDLFMCHPGCGHSGVLRPYGKAHTEQSRPAMTSGPSLPRPAAGPALPGFGAMRLGGLKS